MSQFVEVFLQVFGATFGLMLGVGFAAFILIFFGILLSLFYEWVTDGGRW